MLSSQGAKAGDSFDLDRKVLYARAIAEVEITILPKKGGWKAANARAKEGRIVRTIFRSEGTKVPMRLYFPFSNFSRCWAQLEQPKQIWALAFYPEDEFHGLEEDTAAYTSLNEDYGLLTDAVATVSKWRSAGVSSDSNQAHLALVTQTKNAYLHFLGAHYVKEYEHVNSEVVDKILAKPSSKLSYPTAECDRRPK
jgi:hypothetical protein